MKPREKLLAIIVGAFVALFLLSWGYQQIAGAFEKRHKQIADLEETIRKKQHTLDLGARASKQIAEFQKQSLPSDPELALQLYTQWLWNLVDTSDLADPKVVPLPSLTKNTAYNKFDFTIKAECDLSLKQALDFLYGFYSTNQLHRISQLTLKPKPDGKQMDVMIEVQALIVPGADRSDRLNLEPSKKLQLADAAAYQKLIGGRNLFAEYTPPPAVREHRPEPVVKPTFDVAKYATVTGIIEDNSKPQLWLRVKTTGQTLRLSVGEEFTVGDVQCKVESIGGRDAVVTVAGKRKQVHLEDNLRDAVELPSEEL
jgi:hypothetical protein